LIQPGSGSNWSDADPEELENRKPCQNKRSLGAFNMQAKTRGVNQKRARGENPENRERNRPIMFWKGRFLSTRATGSKGKRGVKTINRSRDRIVAPRNAKTPFNIKGVVTEGRPEKKKQNKIYACENQNKAGKRRRKRKSGSMDSRKERH